MYGRIGKHYAWELWGLKWLGKYEFTFIRLNIEFRSKFFDHTPAFFVEFVLLGLQLIEFDIYNIHHRDENGDIEDYDHG